MVCSGTGCFVDQRTGAPAAQFDAWFGMEALTVGKRIVWKVAFASVSTIEVEPGSVAIGPALGHAVAVVSVAAEAVPVLPLWAVVATGSVPGSVAIVLALGQAVGVEPVEAATTLVLRWSAVATESAVASQPVAIVEGARPDHVLAVGIGNRAVWAVLPAGEVDELWRWVPA